MYCTVVTTCHRTEVHVGVWRASERSIDVLMGEVSIKTFLLYRFGKSLVENLSEMFLRFSHIHRQDQLPLKSFDSQLKLFCPRKALTSSEQLPNWMGKGTYFTIALQKRFRNHLTPLGVLVPAFQQTPWLRRSKKVTHERPPPFEFAYIHLGSMGTGKQGTNKIIRVFCHQAWYLALWGKLQSATVQTEKRKIPHKKRRK